MEEAVANTSTEEQETSRRQRNEMGTQVKRGVSQEADDSRRPDSAALPSPASAQQPGNDDLTHLLIQRAPKICPPLRRVDVRAGPVRSSYKRCSKNLIRIRKALKQEGACAVLESRWGKKLQTQAPGWDSPTAFLDPTCQIPQARTRLSRPSRAESSLFGYHGQTCRQEKKLIHLTSARACGPRVPAAKESVRSLRASQQSWHSRDDAGQTILRKQILVRSGKSFEEGGKTRGGRRVGVTGSG
eukprot:759889-Hanusia_phi.AAC.2